MAYAIAQRTSIKEPNRFETIRQALHTVPFAPDNRSDERSEDPPPTTLLMIRELVSTVDRQMQLSASNALRGVHVDSEITSTSRALGSVRHSLRPGRAL